MSNMVRVENSVNKLNRVEALDRHTARVRSSVSRKSTLNKSSVVHMTAKSTRASIIEDRIKKAIKASSDSRIYVSRYVMDAYEKGHGCPVCHKNTLSVCRLTGDAQEFVCKQCKRRYSLSLISEQLTRV